MKDTGIMRKIDDLGRIVIPKELRTVMDIKVGESVTFFTDDCQLIVRKYEPGCIFCGNAKNIVEFKGKMVCPRCMQGLVKLGI